MSPVAIRDMDIRYSFRFNLMRRFPLLPHLAALTLALSSGASHAFFGDSIEARQNADNRVREALRDECAQGGPPALYPQLPQADPRQEPARGPALLSWRTYPSGRYEALEAAPAQNRMMLTTGQQSRLATPGPMVLKSSLPRDYSRCFHHVSASGMEFFEIQVPERGETRAVRLARQLLTGSLSQEAAMAVESSCEGVHRNWRYRLLAPPASNQSAAPATAPLKQCGPAIAVNATRLLDAMALSFPSYLTP